jgi:hypothetical protein
MGGAYSKRGTGDACNVLIRVPERKASLGNLDVDGRVM